MPISKELNEKLLDIFEDFCPYGVFRDATEVIDFLFQFDSRSSAESFVTLLVRGKTSTYPPLEWDSKEAVQVYAERCYNFGMDGYPDPAARARKAVIDLILEDFNNDLEEIRKALSND